MSYSHREQMASSSSIRFGSREKSCHYSLVVRYCPTDHIAERPRATRGPNAVRMYIEVNSHEEFRSSAYHNKS